MRAKARSLSLPLDGETSCAAPVWALSEGLRGPSPDQEPGPRADHRPEMESSRLIAGNVANESGTGSLTGLSKDTPFGLPLRTSENHCAVLDANSVRSVGLAAVVHESSAPH